jgi:phytoene dehydrogenase-like protein
MSKANNTYDAIIIGAGLSGLICGCYLAKAGMKVLIAEQHHKPGGYCTSFQRKGFLFDAAAHSFGSYRQGGIMRTVLCDLGIDHRISISKCDPSDHVIAPGGKIAFWADVKKTVRELEEVFPNELNIGDFFSFVSNPRPADMAALRNKTFNDLLNQYFVDEKLKALLSFQVFVNGGLPPSLMSAFSGVKLFTEIIVDGGYYPDNGMQALPDAIARRFGEFGGTLLLSSPVTGISVNDQRASGVVLEHGTAFRARHVISNCDARQTFLRLLGSGNVDARFVDKLNSMTSSLSMFIIYLGIDHYFDTLPQPGSTHWFLPHYDLEKMYRTAKQDDQIDMTKYLCRVSPRGDCVVAMTNTSFKDKAFWDRNKGKLLDDFIEIIEQSIIPRLSKHIVYKETATPFTLHRYTLNDRGAAYGWESLPSQSIDADFRKPSFLPGLYLTGHWTTYAQGLGGVVYLGFDLAKYIINKEGIM